MKIFKKKNQSPPTSGPGWSAYIEVPEDFDENVWVEEFHARQARFFLLKKVRSSFLYLLDSMRFRKFLRQYSSVFLDFGSGNYDGFTRDHLYHARATYLLKHKWVQTSFGMFLLEYSIIDGVAFSHYSLNNGLEFIISEEMELSDNPEINHSGLVDLFERMESFCFSLIKAGRSPSRRF